MEVHEGVEQSEADVQHPDQNTLAGSRLDELGPGQQGWVESPAPGKEGTGTSDEVEDDLKKGTFCEISKKTNQKMTSSKPERGFFIINL